MSRALHAPQRLTRMACFAVACLALSACARTTPRPAQPPRPAVADNPAPAPSRVAPPTTEAAASPTRPPPTPFATRRPTPVSASANWQIGALRPYTHPNAAFMISVPTGWNTFVQRQPPAGSLHVAFNEPLDRAKIAIGQMPGSGTPQEADLRKAVNDFISMNYTGANVTLDPIEVQAGMLRATIAFDARQGDSEPRRKSGFVEMTGLGERFSVVYVVLDPDDVGRVSEGITRVLATYKPNPTAKW